MVARKFRFTNQSVQYYFDALFGEIKNIIPIEQTIFITDETIFEQHQKKFKGKKVIVIKPGEQYKTQQTVDSIVEQLIQLRADRQSYLVGVGGGVITDLTGYTASVYMRGIAFGFVPTTLLAMVDACIGGKNGIDIGNYKNIVGTINQPRFLLYDLSFLKTLPDEQWRNGFAEIIKHAAIKDRAMFGELEAQSLPFFQKKKEALQGLIQRNALLKTKVVQEDEFEKGERRKLNFGHTLGHALEKQYQLLHGEAVAIGMAFAANLSQHLLPFKGSDRVISLIQKYGLPVEINYDKEQAFHLLQSDKKRETDLMNYVLLERIGRATVQKIPLSILRNYM